MCVYIYIYKYVYIHICAYTHLTRDFKIKLIFFPAQTFFSAILSYKLFLISKLSEATNIFHPKRNMVKELLALHFASFILPEQLLQLCANQQCSR